MSRVSAQRSHDVVTARAVIPKAQPSFPLRFDLVRHKLRVQPVNPILTILRVLTSW